MSEMSDFGDKNVRLFALFVPIIALISRVDFSQPKCSGRLKSTLLAFKTLSTGYLRASTVLIISARAFNSLEVAELINS